MRLDILQPNNENTASTQKSTGLDSLCLARHRKSSKYAHHRNRSKADPTFHIAREPWPTLWSRMAAHSVWNWRLHQTVALAYRRRSRLVGFNQRRHSWLEAMKLPAHQCIGRAKRHITWRKSHWCNRHSHNHWGQSKPRRSSFRQTTRRHRPHWKQRVTCHNLDHLHLADGSLFHGFTFVDVVEFGAKLSLAPMDEAAML